MPSTRISLYLDPEAPLPLDMPLSEAVRTAITMAQLYLEVPEIPPPSGQPPIKTNFFLPIPMLAWVDEGCASLMISRSEFIRRALHYAKPYWFSEAQILAPDPATI